LHTANTWRTEAALQDESLLNLRVDGVDCPLQLAAGIVDVGVFDSRNIIRSSRQSDGDCHIARRGGARIAKPDVVGGRGADELPPRTFDIDF